MPGTPVKLISRTKRQLPLKNAHEWVSFDDPSEDRTWTFDVTFMLSSWQCIFGNGCQGVLTGPTPELVQGCCSYGAHFVDEADEAKIVAIAKTLTNEQWQFAQQGRARGISKHLKSGEIVSRLVDDACIMLNRPGFPGGPGCALHRAALDRGERPLDLKPEVCWQLPLRREDNERDDGHIETVVKQWDRQHWGDGGEEFHWWCTETSEAFTADKAVYATLRDELVELVTLPIYERLVEYLATRVGAATLTHPALETS